MKINRNKSFNNSFFNNTQNNQTNNNYLARKINAPDEVSFSSNKGNNNLGFLKRLWLTTTALAVSFSLGGCVANTNSQQNLTTQQRKPQTTISEESDIPNTNEKEIKINNKSFYVLNYENLKNIKPTGKNTITPQTNYISSYPKEESVNDIPPTPMVSEEEIIESLPKYAPPPVIEDTPTVPMVPEEEIIESLPKYAPPPIIEDTPTVPVYPDEDIADSLPKYAPPPDIVDESTEPMIIDAIVDISNEEN